MNTKPKPACALYPTVRLLPHAMDCWSGLSHSCHCFVTRAPLPCHRRMKASI